MVYPLPSQRCVYPLPGQEEREGDSPSWFNRQEALVLVELVGDLLTGCERDGLTQEGVGVITPYHRQTQKLRTLLRARGLGRVKVGSTEEFHGHEVAALFISTVRTSPHTTSQWCTPSS